MLFTRKTERIHLPQGSGQHRSRKNRNGVAVNPELGQYDPGRLPRGNRNTAGVEHVEAMEAAEIHDALGVHKTGFTIELLALQTIALVIIRDAAAARVEPREAVIRAQPEIAGAVGENALDHVVW